MTPTRPFADPNRRRRSRGSPTTRLSAAALRHGGALMTVALVGGCAAGPSDPVALSPADYAWCNTAATLCTGWRGPGPFPVGDTSPVGNWIIPAGDEAPARARFVPGEPIVEGEVDDLY